ncbi:MAG: hypothetical protein K2L19_06160, partial [Eubacterium sp.]|nr:hypothetical protein [Eubacterium sp.]
YYIYARDAAENIILLDTFTVDKIDSLTPVISDVQIENADDSTIITVTASDSQSGIAAYSIDNGQTWQDSNILEIEKDSKNYIDIKVKDNVGNVASRRHVFYTPQMYIENDKLCLYSPNPMADDNTIYYSFKNIGGTVKYEKPMDLVDCRSRIYMAFYKTFGRSNPLTIDYKEPNRFSYSESNVDLSLSYNSVRFDIARKYADGEWSYSFDNVLEMNDNGALIRVRMPDLNTYYFVKQSKYLYVSQNYDYELSVVYDDKDSNIVEYIVKCNDVFYHYSPDGKLAEISSKYGTAFSFTYTNDYIKIHDGAGRITLLSFENEWLKVTDASGAVISYLFDDEKLLRVTDQAGVIIAEYAYTDGKISKSMDKSVFYDSDGRVTQYLYDNGYSIKFEYGKDSVTTASSDEKTSTVTYDKYYNILSSTDNFGEITTYTYDKKNLVKVEKSGEIVAEYSYTANGNLSKKTESGETYSYYYDDKNRLEKVYHDNKYTAYQYDDDDNIISTGEFNYVTFYTPAINYTYENGLLVKIEDVDSKTETSYNYDSSGRVIKTTTAVTAEDGTVTTTTTDNLYDEYGNLAKVTSTKEENGEISIAVTDNTYDITGRLLSTSSGDSETSYVYDAAGRTLLVHSDEDYSRTVYDNYGRTVQEIYNNDYNPELDNLPYAYTDKTAGHTYTYSDTNNLISETNEYGITTDYVYSDVGTLYKKSFDIYDYYYQNDGRCDRIDVSGETVIDYEYNVTDSGVKLSKDQYLNTITYADGTVEQQIVDKYGNIYKKRVGDNTFYDLKVSEEKKRTFFNYETDRIIQITNTDDVLNYTNKNFPYVNNVFLDYTVTKADDVTTINETHYGDKSYETVISENNIAYTSDAGTISYSYD